MTDNNKSPEQIADENKKATEEAHQLAKEQQERDRINGVKPVVESVADSIKSKLEREEFVIAVDDDGNQVNPRQVDTK